MPDNDLHMQKHSFPNLVTDEGISILDKDSHPEKQSSPIVVTEEGIEIYFKFLHPLKKLSGSLVKLVKYLNSSKEVMGP